METLLKIFKRKEYQNPSVFSEEEFILKHNFKRYYARTIKGDVEFWAFSEHDEKEKFYLGKLINNSIMLALAYRTYPYDVQKGTGRLCRAYLHNDWREL